MTNTLVWVQAPGGHQLALDGTVLRCRTQRGRELTTLPGRVTKSPVGEQFAAVRQQLLRHAAECRSTVEAWLVGGAPVPAGLLARIWPDPDWRGLLQFLVVSADGPAGAPGVLEGVSEDGQVSLRDPDGSLRRPPGAPPLTLLHPLLLGDPQPWSRLLRAHGAAQGFAQLARRVHHRPDDLDPAATGLAVEGAGADAGTDAYGAGAAGNGIAGDEITGDGIAGDGADGGVDGLDGVDLDAARRRAVVGGFTVRGGFAVQELPGAGAVRQACCWLGTEGSGGPGERGRLLWNDAAQRPVPLGAVGPVAWSEGRRMAEAVYRAVGDEQDGDEQDGEKAVRDDA